ncbi:MAG: class I SAM-dependent methyltransferase [Candidatus Omnitrophica bacterium]|nr:class I SAM-dependent methyltransferase [Candidatus Omnitrophota bacterium]
MNIKLLKKFNEVEKKHWWWEGRRKLLRDLLSKKRSRKILDVGCGTGETLSFLQKTFPKAELYGVDLSQVAVKYAKSRGHKKIFRASALKLPFKKDFFDTILILDVLEHIKNHQKVIYEAKRVLKNKGQIVITSPSLSFLWSDHDRMQGHHRRYTPREIRKLARNANLKASFISYFNFIFSFPIIAIRLLGKIRLFKFLLSYDNGFNYNIIYYPIFNLLLEKIFIFEISLLKFIKYPWGISIVAVLTKENK